MCPVKKGKMSYFCSNPTPLRLGEALHLGEGLFAYANPRLSSNPCLLCLCEHVFLEGFALASSLSIFLSIFIKPKRML